MSGQDVHNGKPGRALVAGALRRASGDLPILPAGTCSNYGVPRAVTRHPEIRGAVLMANELAAMSNELAVAVERTGQSVVAVHARPRFSSSGVFWRSGVIVTAEHTIRREEEITVTLPNGSKAAATLAGSDAGTDVAVLRVEDTGSAPLPRAGALPAPGNLALAIGRSHDSGVNATMASSAL